MPYALLVLSFVEGSLRPSAASPLRKMAMADFTTELFHEAKMLKRGVFHGTLFCIPLSASLGNVAGSPQ
jgi:hypothetical protein